MDKSNIVSDFMFAGVSSTIGKTAIAPLERAKLLLQLQDANSSIRKDQYYRGTRDCLRRVASEQGFLALWRGNFTNVLRYFPTQATNFALKDFFRRKVPKYDPKLQFKEFFLVNTLTGGLAAGVSTWISYPLDFARTKLSVDIGRTKREREFTGLTDVCKKIWKHDGIRGFYVGISVAIPEFVFYRAFYFGCYDSFKMLMSQEQRNNFLLMFLLAQGTTTASGILIYPFDTVRRKLIVQVAKKEVIYSSYLDCVRKTYSNGGIPNFFKGALTNVIRTTGAALVLVLYDLIKNSFVVQNS